MDKKIGIIGYGFVGQAVHSGIRADVEVFIHDPLKGYECTKEVDVAFICVGTPSKEDGSQDLDSVVDAFNQASIIMKAKLVVVKSTVLPGSLSPVGMTKSTAHVVVNPEFLNQNSAVNDFQNQKLCILGGFMSDCLELQRLYQKCFDINIQEYEFCSHDEASIIKYTHNCFNAYKVLFWNYLYEFMGDPRKIARAYKKLREGLPNDFSQLAPDGKLGFGGACFSKDVKALNSIFPHELSKFIIDFNSRIRPE